MSTTPSASRFTLPNSPPAKDVIAFHGNSDLDGSPKAQHHTLGPGANQAAPGNHSHDAGASTALSGYATAAHTHDTAYWMANVPWIAFPFSGGWVNYSSGYAACMYRLVGDEVQFRGLMKHATVTTTGIFGTMPVGYRVLALTDNAYQWPCIGSGITGGIVDVRAFSDGTIRVQGYALNTNGGSISLNTIRYSII